MQSRLSELVVQQEHYVNNYKQKLIPVIVSTGHRENT